jgi:succinate dehydrogenase/fumarate reductase flavoprotein subunit
VRGDMLTLPDIDIPVTRVHTLIIGSGAAGLNAAVQLHKHGIKDLLIVTEGLEMGTSANTGSDKQTYYKLSLCGNGMDSPVKMARTYFDCGSTHGDLALVEASLSVQAFMHLVSLGLPFPQDKYGQFAGYRTDYDPRQRATSIGPYTSREMCRALGREVTELDIRISEGINVVKLVVIEQDDRKHIVGAIALRKDGKLVAYRTENVVLAVGGPGGLYQSSVYPECHTGGIGLALMEGAMAQNLPESQFGLASKKLRWNVSGSYMQVIPRFYSTASDGKSDEQEFMSEYFNSPGEMNSRVFLKGYQWPFDSQKVINGSSLVDILVYNETVCKGRRVFLDFCRNSENFSLNELDAEATEYLYRSEALLDTPIARLRRMNPGAIDLYMDHGINISKEALEIAICAQHNNGGLSGNHWWESTNIQHLFPVGEVNGSHGVYRPGGSALNAGQVAGFRVAEYIANRYQDWSQDEDAVEEAMIDSANSIREWIEKCATAKRTWQQERYEFQARMTVAGSHIRSRETASEAVKQAWLQWQRIEAEGCIYSNDVDLAETLRNRHLCFAHAVYLEAILFALKSGTGSRGSAIELDGNGISIHQKLGSKWCIKHESAYFRKKVLETVVTEAGKAKNKWVPRRAIPLEDTWFETAWTLFREGIRYK